jgi:hypothetical protein
MQLMMGGQARRGSANSGRHGDPSMAGELVWLWTSSTNCKLSRQLLVLNDCGIHQKIENVWTHCWWYLHLPYMHVPYVLLPCLVAWWDWSGVFSFRCVWLIESCTCTLLFIILMLQWRICMYSMHSIQRLLAVYKYACMAGDLLVPHYIYKPWLVACAYCCFIASRASCTVHTYTFGAVVPTSYQGSP